MSEKYNRTLKEVLVVQKVKSDNFLIPDSNISVADKAVYETLNNGNDIESFFFTHVDHFAQFWNENESITKQVRDPLTRYMPALNARNVPYDCTEQNELGDIKLYPCGMDRLPEVDDIISIPCSREQYINCTFYYVVAVKKQSIPNYTRIRWRILKCISF